MSRDVYRLGTQLDFFRLLSFYHSGAGAAPWVSLSSNVISLNLDFKNQQGEKLL